MPSVTNRQSFKEYCLRRLGFPTIEINLDDDQIEDRIDDAFQYWQDYHYDALQKVYYIKQLDDDTSAGWVKFLDTFQGKTSNTNAAKINTHETVKYSDFIKELNRTHHAREDFESVLANKSKFVNIKYTDENTYLSKDPAFEPVEELTGMALFEVS